MQDRAVVFTTTHKPHLERLVGLATSAVEIVGKPSDINDVMQAVKRALAAP
jgi:CheY-like chemotaxis protein